MERGRTSISLLSAMIVLVVAAQACPADAELTFPLRGYFRPGKYMPVRVLSPDGAPVTISATGAVPTTLTNATPSVRTIVPFLPIRSRLGAIGRSGMTQPASESNAVEFRALAPTERLIGVAGGSDEFAERVLFPGSQIISIELDATDPFAGPTAAWEALDAVLLDRFPSPAVLNGLLAAGTTIAVQTSAAPADGLPWERIENYWVLRHPILGPVGGVMSDAYDPGVMWNPGRPWIYRRQVILMIAAFGIIALAAALARPKWGTIACVGVAVVASVALIVARRSQSPVVEANGGVLIASDSFTQRDDWIYRRSVEPDAEATIALAGLMKPILDSERQIEQTGLHLEVTATDRELLQFKYTMGPQRVLAFMTRRITPGRWPGAPTKAMRSPMESLAALYLNSETELRGKVPDPLPGGELPPANTQRWPAIYIDHSNTRPLK